MPTFGIETQAMTRLSAHFPVKRKGTVLSHYRERSALRRRHRAATVLSGLCLAATLAGCAALGDNPQSNNAHGPMQTLTVGANPSVPAATLYLAVDHGLFAAQHLHVTIVNTSGGSAAVPALVGGSYDITSTNDATAILAREKGIPIAFVADEDAAKDDTNTLDALPTSPIKSIKDLSGKTIGISSPNDPPYLALRTEMIDNNVDPDSVHWVTVAYADAETYLTAHRVDATIEADPYRTQTADQTGAVTIVPIFAQNSGFADFPLAGYVTTEKFARAHPSVIASFQRAMVAAATLATTDPALAKAAVLNHTKITPQVADVMDLPLFPSDLDPNRLQRVVTMLQRATPHPLLPAGFQIQSMIIPMPAS